MAAGKGIGRGLGALLGDFSEPTPSEKSAYQILPIHKIEPNPHQPRRDFVAIFNRNWYSARCLFCFWNRLY